MLVFFLRRNQNGNNVNVSIHIKQRIATINYKCVKATKIHIGKYNKNKHRFNVSQDNLVLIIQAHARFSF